MADNRLSFSPSLEDLGRALRQLPAYMANRARARISERTGQSGIEISIAYASHRHSGNLAQHLSWKVVGNAVSVVGIVKNTANHAWLFENGTEGVRHTDTGASRGKMPPARVFIPTMQKHRRELVEEIVDILKEAGLEVTVT